MMAEVKKCTCNHPFQDKTYGDKMRVCNQTKSEKDVRCTVCGKIHTSDKVK